MSTIYWQDGSKANYMPTPGGPITVHSDGAPLFYKSTPDVSQDSHDGSIASGESAVFTDPQWVIAPQGTQTQLLVNGWG